MPHVASETQSHAVKYTQPRAQKAAQAAERSPSAAFESMLDDNATAAADRAPRPDDTRTARADRSQDNAPPAKAKPAKSATADDRQPAATDKPKDKDTDANADKADGAEKAEAPAKDATAETGGDAETAQAPTDATAKPVADPALVAAALDAASATPAQPAPVAVAVPTAAPVTAEAPKTAEVNVLLAAQAAKLQGQDEAGAKTEAPADAPAGGDAKAADAKADEGLLKTAKAHADGKPMHAEPTDADKDQISQARGEAPAHAQRNTDQAPAAADVSPAAAKPAHDAAAPHVSQVQALTNNAASAATPATPAQPAVQQPAVPLGGVAVEIASKAVEGKNRFEIRLDPPELGRIDVRLDVDKNGHVTSRLIVDRQDTLDLLRRDATGLERALQDAGLKTSDNGLQFSLRHQMAEQQQQRQTGGENARLVVEDEALPAADLTVQSYGRLAGRAGGLDIRV